MEPNPKQSLKSSSKCADIDLCLCFNWDEGLIRMHDNIDPYLTKSKLASTLGKGF